MFPTGDSFWADVMLTLRSLTGRSGSQLAEWVLAGTRSPLLAASSSAARRGASVGTLLLSMAAVCVATWGCGEPVAFVDI